MAKDIIVLCLDVGPSMSADPLDGGETSLSKAVRVASQVAQQKMFAGSKDLVGLVLFGTPDTDNELAANGDGYENITVPYLPAPPMVDFLQFLTTVKPGDMSADFIDAIIVAMDIVVRSSQDLKRVGEKKIYLMTDAGSEYTDDQLDQICCGLKAEDIELIVIGPNVTIDDDDDAGENGGSPPPGPSHPSSGSGSSRQPHPPPSSVIKKTPQQVAGEAVIGRLVKEVDGVCFSFPEALQVSTFIRKNAKKQTTRFAGCLEIGERLKIPCKIFTKVMVERPASWKKMSAVSQAAPAGDGTMTVKMERFHHLNDENETEVEQENVSKGYRYGRSLIPISADDEKAMKFEASRCLSLMGFTKMENVKQHQFVGSSVQVVVANPDDENAGKALSAFIHALYETNMVGVVRYVWRKDIQPKLIALLPQIKAESECLLMLQLPFMEDVRQFVFSSLPGERKNAEPSEEQLAAVDSLITNMDLMSADIDEDGTACEALKPKMTCNPIIQRTFQCIAHRALNPKDPLPEIEDSLKRILQPIPELLEKCNDDLQKIKDLFPLQKIEKKTKDNGETAEAWKKTSGLDLDAEAPLAKRPRVEGEEEEEVDFSMASLAKGEITKIGTLSPVSDYQTILKNPAKFIEASKQLQKVTLNLVKESFGDTHYEKAMDCVKEFRKESIKLSQSELFNGFVRDLKTDLLGTRYFPFWEKVVEEGVTLISSTESGDSLVSPEQAIEFIEVNSEISNPTPPAEEDMEDPDDLLELM